MEPGPVEVRWEVAEDAAMRRLVRRGLATRPSFAHSVHVEVDGLDDGREYYYRFTTGGEASPVARTRTAPRGGVNRLQFSSMHLPELGRRLLSRVPRDRRRGPRVRLPPQRLHLRVRRRARHRPARAEPAPRARGPRPRRSTATGSSTPSTRPIRTSSPPTARSRSWSSGTTTRSQNDYTGGRPVAVLPPGRRLPGVLRAPADAPGVYPAGGGQADLPPAHSGDPPPSAARRAPVSRATRPAGSARPSAARPPSRPDQDHAGAGPGALAAEEPEAARARWNVIGNQVLMAELDH